MSTTIESLELEILSNSTSAAKGIDALTQSLEKLGKATKSLGLSGVAKETGKISDAMNKVSTANAKTSKSFTDLYHKIKAATNTFKTIGKAIYSSIEKSSDYVENVNLFTVAMGEYASEAKQYADTVSEAMGIDPGEWMRNQGVFMTLATGFGVAGDRAATMSKNLTQLGYDLSSFYNISTEEAMQKIKSGFAGELEPLRAVGYDLSQAKLEATAFALGVDKSVSSMTQAEKAQLRYYAIMTQVTTVQGDMARTLESPANQMRVFKAQVNMAAREIGNMFIPALNAILPYAIAVTKVIRTLASNIASLFGYEMPDMSESTSTVVENTDALQENLEKGTEEAKKLKSYMLGFDELNVINPNEGQDEGSGEFDFELPEYDFLEGLAESRVAEIVEDMKEWLGLTDDIDSWSELFDTRLGHILKTVGLIGAGIAAWKVTKTLTDAVTAIGTLLASPTYAIAISVLLTITGIAISIDGMESAIKDGLDGFNFAEIVGGALIGTAGIALLASKIATAIDTAFGSSAIALKLTEWGINLGMGTIGGTAAALSAAAMGIIAGIPMFFIGIYDAIKEGLDWLNGLLISLGATLVGAGIGFLVGGPVGAAVGAVIGLVVGLISDLIILIEQNWDVISAWIDKHIVQPMKPFFKPLTDACEKAWEWLEVNLFTPLSEAFTEVKDYATEKFVEIKDGVVTAFTTVRDKVVEIKDKIVEIFTALKWAFDEYVWNPLKEKVSAFYNEHIKPIVDTVKTAAQTIWDAFKEKVFDKVKSKIDGLIENFKKFGKGVVDFIEALFKSVINAVLSHIEDKINSFIRLLNGAVDIINLIPGVNITAISEINIPRLAEGGFPEQGQLFIAREAGAEMVGNIGRRTAVANNDQIVAGIAGGVAEANGEQNALLREQNSLLRAILEKDSGTYLDGKLLTNSVEKYQRERGRVLITGGVV